MARLLTSVVRALADHPATARALAGDAADRVHVHAGLVGRPHPCADPRCAPGASAPRRQADTPAPAPVAPAVV